MVNEMSVTANHIPLSDWKVTVEKAFEFKEIVHVELTQFSSHVNFKYCFICNCVKEHETIH